jgi:acetyltransferase-like isoleucine patch superfamily enzyme
MKKEIIAKINKLKLSLMKNTTQLIGYQIVGTNNKIIIMDDNNEYPLPANQRINGLNINISGSNNLIKIDKYTIFQNSFFNLESNNSAIEIFRTQPIVGMSVSCWENNQNFVWGKDSTTWGVSIFLNEEKASLVVGKDCMLSGAIDIWPTDGHVIFNISDKKPINAINGPVIIGDHCWIGSHVIITKGARIPNNTIVGTGSVVTKAFIKENSVIAGNPAEVIKSDVNWDRKTPFSWQNDM